MSMQEEYEHKRNQYLANKISHDAFYLWLAGRIGITVHDLPFTLEQIAMSTDPDLNDLALCRWDNCDPLIQQKALQAGMRSWSIFSTVCVLKAYARHKVPYSAK